MRRRLTTTFALTFSAAMGALALFTAPAHATTGDSAVERSAVRVIFASLLIATGARCTTSVARADLKGGFYWTWTAHKQC